MLGPPALDAVHAASLRILAEVGVELLDRECLALLRQHGARVDEDLHRVYLPTELVEWAISQAPSRFLWEARNPQRSVEVGGDSLVLVPVGGPSMVYDLERGRRPGTYEDQINFIKLAQTSDLLDAAYRSVEANDLPPATRYLDYLYAAIRYSDKPLSVMTLGEQSARDSLALAGLVLGEEPGSSGRCLLLGSVNVDSPLRFSAETLRALLLFARAGQPLLITPFILPGVLSPATMAGALAQQNAENLAGVTLTQLAHPGTPVVYGSFAAHVDMRCAAPVFGGAEPALMEVAAGQLAARYGLPHRGMGLVTTSRESDAQAAWEKMNCLRTLAFSNTHLLLHAAGWLEGGLTAGYEQFAFDLEMLDSLRRFLGGMVVDEHTLGLDAVAQVGPGGSYLLTDHTLANHRESCRLSPLVDARPAGPCDDPDSHSLVRRAHRVWRRYLSEYEEPALSSSLHGEIVRFIERRKGSPVNI
ncbi:MAG: trimethylamine methyltransferase family protein [Chloroflexota bacterium]